MSSKTFNNTKINVEFDEDYQSRTNINSGENISSLFAKIRRFILDLKSVAFSGSYNDLSDTPDVVTKEYVDPIKSQAAINRTTLGTQCKNLLKNTAKTSTISGITFTVNDDCSVTANGTNSTSNYVNIKVFQGELEAGTYILSGTPANNSICRMRLGLGTANGYGSYVGVESGNGYTFTVTEKAVYIVLCQITNGKTVSNVIFKPMLRYADITDDTYEPYSDNVDTRLTKNKSDIAINRTTLGTQCKNLFNSNAVNWYQPTKTSIAKDGTITSTVTSDSRTWGIANAEYFLTLSAGKYIIRTVTETINNTVSYPEDIRGYNESGTILFDISPKAIGTQTKSFTLTETTTIAIMFKLFTQTCKIMIHDAGITDDTYEPYKENVDERLTENKSNIAINKITLGYRCKNLLKNTASTTTVNNVTFTVNSDGSITAKQTTTAYGNATIDVATNITLNPGTYILTGDDEIKKSGYGEIRFYINGTIYAANTAHTFDEEVTISAVRIFVWKGVNINGSKTIYPMLRYAGITDDTYEPYKGSVDERLIQNKSDIAVNKSTLGYQRKNILNETEYLSSITSVSIGTFNISGNSITLTATGKDCYTKPHTSSDGGYRIPVEPDTDYILSWESDNTYAGLVYVFMNGNLSQQKLANNKDTKYIKFTTNSDTTFITFRLGVTTSGNSITYSNIMLRYADILDDTYEPYQPSVQEQITALEERIAALGG